MSKLRWRPGNVSVQLATMVLSAAALILVTALVLTVAAQQRIKAVRLSGEMTALAELTASTERVQQIIDAERWQGAGQPGTPFPARVALAVSRELDVEARQAARVSGSGAGPQLADLVAEQQAALEALVDGDDDAFARLADARARLDALALETAGPLDAAAGSSVRHIERIAPWAEAALMGAVVASISAMGCSTWLVARRQRCLLVRTEQERGQLALATQVTERRNEQFRALYLVVGEVSESLSLKYVVATAVREARKLMAADVAGLRLVREGFLEVTGVEADVEADVAGLRPVPLGQGLTGRVAKRGRSILITDDAEASMVEAERIVGVRSGMVVPLIVGARVVGTLACWSREPGRFAEDDQQVLEMMASQVATAVAAADSHEASEQLAHTDTLTGLPNRRGLTRDTADRFQPMLASGRPVAIGMADIDHFKQFNDDHGHKAGDITLQKVAETLRAAVREGDNVYRYGGEEFVIVIEDARPEEAFRRLERVRAAVARVALTGPDFAPMGPVTISIGLAAGPDDSANFEHLLQLADDGLYQAKWAGRNQVVAWEADRGLAAA